MHVHLLTCEELPDLSPDDRLWAEALGAAGHAVSVGVWGRAVPAAADVAVVRSCWDYTADLGGFAAYLDGLGCPVWNPAATVLWSGDKVYLRDLEGAGVRIVPTRFDGRAERSWAEVVVKPRVSNAGLDVRRVSAGEFGGVDGGRLLVQRFLPEIAGGEYSAVFVGGGLTHWVRKVPACGEYRVQHFYGGTYERVDPPGAAYDAARGCWGVLRVPALYGRLDFIPADGGWLLGECELVEPWLHFDLCPEAAVALTAELERAVGGGLAA